MKAYTDIPQSKKLAEILPIESADMRWFSEEDFYEKVHTLSSQLPKKEMYKNHKKIELNYGR